MFAEFLQRAILGPRQYLKQSDLDKMTRRTPFSSFLNYLAYDPDLEIYPEPGRQPWHVMGVLSGHLCRSQNHHCPGRIVPGRFTKGQCYPAYLPCRLPY